MVKEKRNIYKGVSPITNMKKRVITSTREVYMEDCPKCHKEIRAFSESNLKYNMKLHIESCKGKNKK